MGRGSRASGSAWTSSSGESDFEKEARIEARAEAEAIQQKDEKTARREMIKKLKERGEEIPKKLKEPIKSKKEKKPRRALRADEDAVVKAAKADAARSFKGKGRTVVRSSDSDDDAPRMTKPTLKKGAKMKEITANLGVKVPRGSDSEGADEGALRCSFRFSAI